MPKKTGPLAFQTLFNGEGENTGCSGPQHNAWFKQRRRMLKLGQNPSQQDAKVQKQNNEPQETADPSAEREPFWNLEVYHLEINHCPNSMCKNGSACSSDLLGCGRREHRCQEPLPKPGVFKCFHQQGEYIDIDQHRSQHDAKTKPQSLHVQGRQRCLECWELKFPVQRFRIPHWDVHAHGLAE